MKPQTTGFLATECPACQGNGRISWLQGMEQLSYSADCDDCRGTGWEVEYDDDGPIPAIAIDRVVEFVDADLKYATRFGQNATKILTDLVRRIRDDFEEAR